jgi:hypothetical protein
MPECVIGSAAFGLPKAVGIDAARWGSIDAFFRSVIWVTQLRLFMRGAV